MPEIRAMVFDLDKTLLRSDRTISPYTLSVLQQRREKGIRSIIATARPSREAKRYEEMICSDAAVTMNGASIRINGRETAGATISAERTQTLLRDIERLFPGRRWSVEAPDGFYACFDTTEIWPDSPAHQVSIDTMPPVPSYKVLISLENAGDAELLLSVLPENAYLEIAEGVLGMVIHREATKLKGVLTALHELGIAPEETAAFGDDLADIGMLRECGFGVAVANALHEVKAAAGYITASNDEDGVAVWLEKYAGI